MDEPTSRDRARRARAREVATHRRAVELHEKAVLNLTESRHFDRAEAAQMRLAKARRRLQEALEHEQLLQGPGYAAMAPRASDKVVHAVPDGQRTSLCGLETAFMVGVAKDFGAMPPARQCPECVRASKPGDEPAGSPHPAGACRPGATRAFGLVVLPIIEVADGRGETT